MDDLREVTPDFGPRGDPQVEAQIRQWKATRYDEMMAKLAAGFVVVPAEPTEAMDDAGSLPYSLDEGHNAVYRAMIEASNAPT